LIFDHWNNFAYHEMEPQEAEPKAPKSLAQRRYEARLALAHAALRGHEPAAFASVCELLLADARALNDQTIAVRDHWPAVQLARDAANVNAFAPATAQMLADTIAPLLNALDLRGQGDALRWDILLANAQHEAIAKPDQANACRADILAWLARLPPNLNAVRAKADELKAIQSDSYWHHPDFARLEASRLALRELMHLAERPAPQLGPGPTFVDIAEDISEYHVEVRKTNIRSVDATIYRQSVEAALRPLFDSSPVLQKIRDGQRVTDAELDQLNSLIHTRHPGVDLQVLREFYADTAAPLADILRSIVGMDAKAVEARFADFAQRHRLDSQQLRFLGMLKDQICKSGSIRLDALFEAPFTSIHGEGIGGLFPRDEQLGELTGIIRSFGEPPALAGPTPGAAPQLLRKAMITGELKNKIDSLWTDFWTGGITNPLTVIEQITFLMYSRLLDMQERKDSAAAPLPAKPSTAVLTTTNKTAAGKPGATTAPKTCCRTCATVCSATFVRWPNVLVAKRACLPTS